MEFKEQLSRIRKDRGYNQEQLAEKVGVSRQAVSKWETGDAQPALSQLIALADALDVSLDILCCREGDRCRSYDDNENDMRRDCAHHDERDSRAEGRSEKDGQRAAMLFAFLPLLLAVLIVGGMYFHLYRQNLVPSESDTAENRLPDTIQVTGLNFHSEGTPPKLYYEFSPSVVSDDLIYTLTFTDSSGRSQSFEIPCDNGVCTGAADLPAKESFSAVLEISSGEERRAVALATGLTFGDGRVSWVPAE